MRESVSVDKIAILLVSLGRFALWRPRCKFLHFTVDLRNCFSVRPACWDEVCCYGK